MLFKILHEKNFNLFFIFIDITSTSYCFKLHPQERPSQQTNPNVTKTKYWTLKHQHKMYAYAICKVHCYVLKLEGLCNQQWLTTLTQPFSEWRLHITCPCSYFYKIKWFIVKHCAPTHHSLRSIYHKSLAYIYEYFTTNW